MIKLTQGRARAASRSFPVVLALVALAGLAVRIAYVVGARHSQITGDGPWYHFGAIFLADGDGFLNPIQYLLRGRKVPGTMHPPIWTSVLAFPSWLGWRTYLEHQLFATFVGTATVVVVGLAGRRIAGARAGLIAAALAALYPNVWLWERQLLSETLLLLGSAVTIAVAYAFWKQPRAGLAIGLGVLCGLLALTRAEQGLLIVTLVLPLVLGATAVPWRRRLQWFAGAALALALVIAPWAAYNTSRQEKVVLLTTGLGTVLRVANCDTTYSGPAMGYWHRSCERDRDLTGDASERDLALRRRATDYAREHLTRLPVVVLAREGRTWALFRPFQQIDLDTRRGTYSWVVRAGLFSYWALVPVAVVGAVVLRRRRITLIPLLAPIVTVAATVAVTFGQTRYRAPAEIPIVLLAGVAIDAFLSRARRSADGGVQDGVRSVPGEPIMAGGQ